MLFAISPGSDSTGDNRFSAYLPFVLAPGRDIEPSESPVKREMGAETLTLERIHGLYALTLGDFDTYSAAQEAIGRLQIALLWISLKQKLGLRYSKSIGSVELFDQPKPIPEKGIVRHIAEVTGWETTEGQYDADKSVIRPESKKLVRWQMGGVTVHAGLGVEVFFQGLSEAFSFPRLEGVRDKPKLQLGLEIYGSFAFESSHNAQFLNLITALEALLPDVPVPPGAAAALENAKATIRRARDSHAPNSEPWSEIDHLLSRLGNLGRRAIGSSLRDFVTEILGRHPDLGDAAEVSDRLNRAYAVRSKLIHDGVSQSDEVRRHLSFLRDLTPRLLETLYREAVSRA